MENLMPTCAREGGKFICGLLLRLLVKLTEAQNNNRGDINECGEEIRVE